MLEQLHAQPPEMLPLHQDDFLEPLRDQIDAAEQVAEVADAAEPIVFAAPPVNAADVATGNAAAGAAAAAVLDDERFLAVAVGLILVDVAKMHRINPSLRKASGRISTIAEVPPDWTQKQIICDRET